MYTVGRLISQGAYTVSGPFHPFGGAVDVVVVQQQDGSLKSSPWYVKFGKFQGVLKANVRIVNINVNGIDAGFHMHLDPRGEAYFLREIDSSSCGDINGNENSNNNQVKFDQCDSVSDVSNGAVLARTNSRRSRIMGFVLGKRSVKEQVLSKEENNSNLVRRTSLETAVMAADLLEMKWSTNLNGRESRNDGGDVTGGRLEASLVLHEEHFVNKLEDSGVDLEVAAMEVEETVVTDVYNNVNKDIDENFVSEESSRNHLDNANEQEEGLIIPESDIEVVSSSSISVPICENVDDNLAKEENETNEIRSPLEPNYEFQVSEGFVEEQLIFGDLDDSKPNIDKIEEEVKHLGSESTYEDQEHFKGDFEGLKGIIGRCPSNVDVIRSCEVTEGEIGRQAKSLPNMWFQFNDSVADHHEDPQFDPSVGKPRTSKWDLLREDPSRIKKANLEKELQQDADNLTNEVKDGSIVSGGPPNAGSGRWRWPFRRQGSKNVSDNQNKDSNVNVTVAETNVEKEWCPPKSDKMYTRSLTPTPDQLASLNLVEGKNIVTFTFSTSVLGPQKVDARIYLWRWDTRIVISDVDGTITKSDVLGQFMPMVGRDWSHIGVTHLFSAIKENGYQMLYLSARAISQASNTRQFLFNLKQDGKELPDGPVVISPDGLFPSLFREVIRRVPHEFKIACLEDIRVCFPSDRNPFYAGFGNRITDEFSYLKVGIPKGKIFIINHKGEVVINRSIDSRSYASIHALVNGIFPPVSVHEEEDYNSWNFWKLPPPTIE